MRKVIVLLITLYQKTVSPDHGPFRFLWPYGFCRQIPTCSEYAKEMMHSRGIPCGTVLAVKRIVQCNPWTRLSDEKLRETSSLYYLIE